MDSMVTNRRWMAGLVVGAVALVGVGTAAVTASLSMLGAPPKGATVAVVDLEKLINGLDEKRAKGEEYKKAFDAKQKELENLQKQIQERATAVKAMPEGTGRTKAAEELREMVYRGELEAKLASRRLDSQQADLFRDLYLKVDAAVEQISKQNGYHMVLVSDEGAEIPENSNSENILRAITMKRMLYIAKELDITDEVIKFMNNSFAAAGGVAPKAPAAATKPVAKAN